MRIENVDSVDIKQFKALVEEYWRELMPKAAAMRSSESFDAQFRSTFEANSRDDRLHVVFEGDQPVGLFLYKIDGDQRRATVSSRPMGKTSHWRSLIGYS